jgi:hypothetical protein
MYYENRQPDFSPGKDTFPAIYWSDGRMVYWLNIFDQDDKCVGDVSCHDSIELEKWVEQHNGKIVWRD